jgi:chemotaxis protein methyltransferase CheR
MKSTSGAQAEAALTRVLGLRLEVAMRGRLERCLRESAAAARLALDEFTRRVGDGDEACLQLLVDRVTVQETWFFREPGQFDALAVQVLPQLGRRPLTVWSAGCANGQEAYSLAMVLAESGLSAWRVLATDVSSRALARTRAGRYTEQELRGLNEQRRGRFLRRVDDEWEVVPELRERVDVCYHNLVLDAPPLPDGSCDAVLCRNVLIYLRPEEAAVLLERVTRVLAPGCHLFLGSADFNGRPSADLELVRLGGAFAYRRSAGATPPPVTRLAPAAVPAPPRRTSRPRPAPTPVAAPLPDIVALLDAGERAVAAADLDTAIRAFRQVVCLRPDHAVAHTCLALALEAAGEPAAATRAFSAARSALARSDAGAVERGLDGFRSDELASFLSTRLESQT